MTFEQMLYVEMLSQYRSLQKAADALHISKPGLSLAISSLEKELGTKLFNRTNKGTELTATGIKLLSTVSDILKSKAELERIASFSNDTNKKEIIRIRYINTMFKSFLTPFIKKNQPLFGHVTYDLCRSDTKSIISLVKNGEINAGFIASSDIESAWIKGLVFKPVCYGRIVLCAAETNALLHQQPLTFESLKSQTYCLYDDAYHEAFFDRLQYICGPLNLILKTDDHWAIHEALTKLNAVTFGRNLQAVLSREEINDGVAILDIGHLFNDKMTLGWLTNPRVKQSSTAICLMNEITKQIQKEI